MRKYLRSVSLKCRIVSYVLSVVWSKFFFEKLQPTGLSPVPVRDRSVV